MTDHPFGRGQEQIRARPALGRARDREPSLQPTGRRRSRQPRTGASKLGRDLAGWSYVYANWRDWDVAQLVNGSSLARPPAPTHFSPRLRSCEIVHKPERITRIHSTPGS
jgi:hypothetical protein